MQSLQYFCSNLKRPSLWVFFTCRSNNVCIIISCYGLTFRFSNSGALPGSPFTLVMFSRPLTRSLSATIFLGPPPVLLSLGPPAAILTFWNCTPFICCLACHPVSPSVNTPCSDSCSAVCCCLRFVQGFLTLPRVTFWTGEFFAVGAVLYIVVCLAAPLASMR